MRADNPADGPVAARERRAGWIEVAILLAAAGAIGATLCLHFLRPHGDFYEFRESGAALLAGELPETTKRGPVFPLVMGILGRLAALLPRGAAPAEQLAGALLNATLLPVIVLLAYFVTRGWSRAAAPWAGVMVLVSPQLWLAGAHALVEPLLAALMLATVLLVQRGSGWAHVCAAIAAVTRYDLAGLLAGVALVDWMRGAGTKRVALRAALAAAPLAAWLALTIWTWPTHSRDHYIEQMREHAQRGALHFDPLWAMRNVLNATGAAARPGLPIWAADLRPVVQGVLPIIAGVLVIAGAAIGLRRRDGAMAAAVAAVAGYLAVHALFPFRLERFGFPPAPLIIAMAASGGAAVLAWARGGGAAVRAALLAVALVIFAGMAFWEFDALGATWIGRDGAARVRSVAALLAVLGIAACIGARCLHGFRRERGAGKRSALGLGGIVCGSMAAIALVLANGRDAHALLGKRQRSSTLVDAAAWVCRELPADVRVLSGVGGLLALHCGSGTGRFPGFEQIDADDWDAILRECNARRIEHAIWYEGFLEEQGEYYVKKWRLERFAPLDSEAAGGLEVVRRFAGHPSVVIFRVPAEIQRPATHPSGASSSDGAPTGTAPGGGGSPIPSPPRKSP